MTSEPLHLAYCDGVFDFDCAECPALCCRGAGFAGSMAREVPRLLELYPGLASLAVTRQGDIVHFANPSSGCFFLDADRLCRIEREHERSLKPGVCMLFPFNALLRVGDTIVIRPHFLCPLRALLPARPGEGEGAHGRVAQIARASGLLEASVPTAVLHPTTDASATVAREAWFRDRSGEALGRLRFRDLLRDEAQDGPMLDDAVRRAGALLGLDAPPSGAARDDIDDLLILVAAPLRTTMLRLSADGLLVVLSLGERIFRHAAALGARPSVSGAWEIVTRLGPALRLLGRLDEPLVVDPASPLPIPSFNDPAVALAAAVALRASPGTGTLAALERAAVAELPTVDRSVLLGALGTALEAKR